MISASEALSRLIVGNQRFRSGHSLLEEASGKNRRQEVSQGQNPFAIILGCSDSRVPAEIVFDQGLGELFVIRVAGNIVAPSQIGSVEFAADQFGTRLVVVLGHTQCGAISATIEQLRLPKENQSPHIRSIVERVRPSVEVLMSFETEDIMKHAVRANVRASVNHLKHGSEMLEHMVAEDGMMIVGAEYCLESGYVDFFDLP